MSNKPFLPPLKDFIQEHWEAFADAYAEFGGEAEAETVYQWLMREEEYS